MYAKKCYVFIIFKICHFIHDLIQTLASEDDLDNTQAADCFGCALNLIQEKDRHNALVASQNGTCRQASLHS